MASQEHFHSGRGLVKSSCEENLSIPAVVRLGGNSEDEAVKILTEYTKDLPAPVEGYRKDDTAAFCAERMQKLLSEQGDKSATRKMADPCTPEPNAKDPYTFDTPTGKIVLDHALCRDCESHICIETCVPQILKNEGGVPVLNISRDDAKAGKCTECLACEVECHVGGNKGGFVVLPIPGLQEYRAEMVGAQP